MKTHYSPDATAAPGFADLWASAPCGAGAGRSEYGVNVTALAAAVTCGRCLPRARAALATREIGMHTGARCESIDPHTGTRCVLRLGHADECLAPIAPELAEALAGVLAAARSVRDKRSGDHDG